MEVFQNRLLRVNVYPALKYQVGRKNDYCNTPHILLYEILFCICI